jgi:hypothetical protein
VLFVKRNGAKNVSGIIFNNFFSVPNTIFYRKLLKKTKNYQQNSLQPTPLSYLYQQLAIGIKKI